MAQLMQTSFEEIRVRRGLLALQQVQRIGAEELGQANRALDAGDFRTAALGAFVELGELVNECDWKTWREPKPFTTERREKVLKEFGDVLHFLAWILNNLEARYGLTSPEFAAAFMLVHDENVRRFRGEVPGREPPEQSRSVQGESIEEDMRGLHI